MPEILNHPLTQFTFNSIRIKSNSRFETRKLCYKPFKCVLTEDKRRAVVKNGKDSLDICRVVNGMWQTSSGGWGKIDPDNAIEAMLRYADAGFTTFDMADIC